MQPAPGDRHTLRRQLRRDLFISLLAVVSVGIGVLELARPRVDARFTAIDALDLAIVAVFIWDFVTHARASGDWRRYARRHWYEIPSLIPITGGLVEGLDGIAVVRGVRLVRLVRVVRLLRIVGAAARLRSVRRYVGRVAERAQLVPIAAVGAGLVLVGAAAAWVAEGGSNPRMGRFSDALWWSLNLFTTVAYVDYQPRTSGGFVIGGLLQVLGIAFVGVFTASLASAILKEPGPDEEQTGPEPPLD